MRKLSYIELVEASAAILLILYFYLLMSRFGASWDNIVGHFNTLTMAGKSSYYEILREPLAQLILLPGVLLGLSLYQDMLVAQAFLALFLLFCTKKLAESLKIEGISVYLISLSLVIVTFAFTLNITDILGISTALLAFAYYFDKDYTKSSVVFGLSFLAKFTNLIFLPCMLFMFKGKWRVKSIAIALLVNLPWFIANYYLYNNPIYGFELSNQVFAGQHTFAYSTIFSALESLGYVLETVIILAIIIVILLRINKNKISSLVSGITKVDMIVLGFALFEFIYVGSAQNYVPWLLYPLFISLMIIALKVLSKISLTDTQKIAINRIFLLIFLSSLLLLIYHTGAAYNGVDWQLWFSKNPSYNESLNPGILYSCSSTYSNAWPYLMIYNLNVKPLYQINSSITPGSCLIIFNPNNTGVPINLSTLRYTVLENSSNYSIIRYDGQAT